MTHKTKLLVSVTNVEEALIAVDAGVDFIDLKDPNVGALGALPLNIIREIVLAVNQRAVISSTVGEHHQDIAGLIHIIQQTALLGVDIIKIAMNMALVNDLLDDVDFLNLVKILSKNNIKLVAVLFVDHKLDLNVVSKLKLLDFYGAMLDTAHKNGKKLIYYLPNEALENFIQQCIKYRLVSGFAGSLNLDSVINLVNLQPSYLGFRGGVCKNFKRQSTLDKSKIAEIKNLLQENNKVCAIAHQI